MDCHTTDKIAPNRYFISIKAKKYLTEFVHRSKLKMRRKNIPVLIGGLAMIMMIIVCSIFSAAYCDGDITFAIVLSPMIVLAITNDFFYE